jgi:DNA-directed RNA polymerase specialized sigma24 family protein
MAPPAKQPAHEFPTTWWTLIDQAQADGTTLRNSALEQLVLRYVPPLRAHLVLRRRVGDELADELLQAFVTEKIVAQYLLRHADRGQGKFRSLLVRSLENFYVDWVRARANRPGAPLLDELAPAETPGPDAFDVAWARQLLDEVLATMRADCQADLWGVFECRLLKPTREGVEPLAYDAVCRRFAFASPEQASNALVTAKRKFQRAFERVAARYCHDGEPAEQLLGELCEVLSQAGPLEWQQVPQAAGPAHSASGAPEELDESQPALIARLLNVDAAGADLWDADDLAQLMRHQLAQPLASLAPRAPRGPASPRDAAAAPLETFADLFCHPAPPLEVLEAVKRHGRKHAGQPDESLPIEIASALYFAGIAAALVRHNERITKLDDELLRAGFQGMLAPEWIPPPLRELYAEALAQLGPGEAVD